VRGGGRTIDEAERKENVNLNEIELKTKLFADAHEALSAEVTILAVRLERAQRDALPTIKDRLRRLAERAAVLQAALKESAELFEKPRTRVFHGVQVGFRKKIGGLTWEDDETVVARIEKLFGERAPEFLHIAKKPDAAALGKLAVCELMKLGVQVEKDTDAVVLRPVDGDAEKLVRALLGNLLKED
jgi:hypothetical protein